MTDKELMHQALNALEGADQIDIDMRDAIVALKSRLEQAAIEPQVDSNLLKWKEWALSLGIDERNQDLCDAISDIEIEFDAVERALLGVLTAVQAYLPPDGISAQDAIAICISQVDPWPLPAQQKETK